MTPLVLVATALLLAYANGANDNFKAAATLWGSKTTSFWTAITWTTVTTAAGSMTAVLLAGTLLKLFSGKGVVPEALATTPSFVLALGLGAGGTVLLATVLGFPISTTHALTGALMGAGYAAVGAEVNWSGLGRSFFLPLLVSPVLAVLLAGLLSRLSVRRLPAATAEVCLCVAQGQTLAPEAAPSLSQATATTLVVSHTKTCNAAGATPLLRGRVETGLHFLSAGAVAFARGLNDTPKMAALLLLVPGWGGLRGMMLVGLAIAVGGLLQSRRVAETMAHKITPMGAIEGLTANLSTALLVLGASKLGVPVSTTHVSVGSLFGLGLRSGRLRASTASQIILSWVVTLPISALLGALTWLLAS